MSTQDMRSIPELLEHALSQGSQLVSNEVALVRAEIAEKAAMMGRGVVMIGFGALLLVPAMIMILLAVSSLLIERGMPVWQANLSTGVGALLIGGFVAWMGANNFSAHRLAPRRTAEQLRRDGVALKEMVR